MTPLLELVGVSKRFAVRGGAFGWRRREVTALAEVDLAVAAGESVALVGESGCGKTTLARCAVALIPPSSGSVRFDGVDLTAISGRDLRRLRRRFQVVFQDPLAALDPRQRVGAAVAEPFAVHGTAPRAQRRAAVDELLAQVGLAAELGDRFPHQLSGGQRQRAVIARSLACRPDLLVADEPLSALDVSVRAQILNLFGDLRRQYRLSLLWITHDLASAEAIADRVVVLYAGRVVESGPASRVLAEPWHPYTSALLAAVPRGEPQRRKAALPRADEPQGAPARGCPFRPRCSAARARCAEERPELAPLPGEAEPERRVACFYPGRNFEPTAAY
jgi:oligopeptide/dipeptide ABC transporter ATP-binding protein